MRNQSRIKGDGGTTTLLEVLRCMHSDYDPENKGMCDTYDIVKVSKTWHFRHYRDL